MTEPLEPPPLRAALVVVEDASQQGVRYELRKHEISIGRDERNDIRIAYPFVSRRQARIRFVTDHFELEDLGSSGGSYINDTHVRAATPLCHGDHIRLDMARFRFEIA